MALNKKPEMCFPIKLSVAQRKIVAVVAPIFADRLKMDEPNQRIIEFNEAELKILKATVETAIRNAKTASECRPLRLVLKATDQAISQTHIRVLSAIVYQLKITLLNIKPSIWRRIQVKNCSLEKLHEYIQTAMGWTNSHLHHFQVGEQLYGDPELMQENFEDMEYKV